MIGARLERIEARLEELKGDDKRGRRILATISPGKIQIKTSRAASGHKCKMGRMILALGILGILVPVESARTVGPETGRELAYDGIQGLLEGVAMGIEEKQSEMKEIKKMELIELEKTVRRRQMLLDLTSREVEERAQAEGGKRRMEEERIQVEGTGQLHGDDYHPRRSSDERIQDIGTASYGGVHPLWPLGDFRLGRSDQLTDHCIKKKAWTSRKTNSSVDASTSTSESRPENGVRDHKPTSLSFQDERTWWEWPRRRTPPSGKARGVPRREVKKHEIEMKGGYEGEASWGECDK